MRVVAVDEARGLALCAAADGARESVEIALVDAVAPGDGLLVHAGTALARLDATEVGT
jgi:hydrogenase expression/formation protein HypC